MVSGVSVQVSELICLKHLQTNSRYMIAWHLKPDT